jgi:quercetin dioxygenase-like cupin family protein
MPVDVFESLTHPVTGETFRCISADENAYVFEWTVASGGYVPFEHVHLFQDEIFRVLTGAVRLIVDGEEIIGKGGDTVTVEKGQRHIAFNHTGEVMKCIVEFRPGFDTKIVMQCFWGLILDGDYDKHGTPSIFKMGYFVKGCQALTRPANIPAAVFNSAVNLFYWIGKLMGWEKLYKKYTGRER